jgi:hypothetical protein
VKRFLALFFALLVLGMPAASAKDLDAVDVTDLLENSADYVGEITIVGELIGDYGFRSDGFMWTQLNDDSYALDPVLDGGKLTGGNTGVAVRMPSAIAEQLDPPGGYRVRGPVISATGIWKHHDPERGGETYLDVTGIIVVEQGRDLPEHPHPVILGVGLVLVLGALVALRRSRR